MEKRSERLEKRNDLLRARFKKMAALGKYKSEYIINELSKSTGFHPNYIRTIIKDTQPPV